MQKTLSSSGQILFDELEQVAVRRGGFASLEWLKDKDASLAEIREDVQSARPAPRTGAGCLVIATAPQVRDYSDRVPAAVRSVQDLARVVEARCKAARQVLNVAFSVAKEAEDPEFPHESTSDRGPRSVAGLQVRRVAELLVFMMERRFGW